MIDEARNLLRKIYGYDDFLPMQEDIISNVLQGNDTLALLPTGGGKSLCYQIPGLQMHGICIVVSPLVALIKDQVNRLSKLGIKAIGLTGSINYRELDDVLDNAVFGNYKFLYLSPERLLQPLVQERLTKMTVNLIAVDEAHCISEWGHDFRPAYREIHLIKELLPGTPLIALTATATVQVQQDIIDNLEIPAAKIFKNSFKRDNITYRILETPDKRKAAVTFYRKKPLSSIAYVRSRKNCIEYAGLLEQNGITSGFYHGGLDNKMRDRAMNGWMDNSSSVMVATNAFGMGIDKPDVRSIVHLQLPDSIESYYQETGRAGRDGKRSIAQFIYNINDLNHAHNQFIKSLPTVVFLKLVYRKLNNYLQIAKNEGVDATHRFSFAHFCRVYDFNGLACYNALQALERFCVLIIVQEGSGRTKVRFRESGKAILHFAKNDTVASSILQAVMRTYGSSQHQEISINIGLIALRSSTSENKVLEILEKMAAQELIEAQLSTADTQVTFLVPREDDKTINNFGRQLEAQNKVKNDKLNSMMQLVQNRTECIQNYILKYFGEPALPPCGKCTVCNPKIPRSNTIDESLLLKILAKPLSFEEIKRKTSTDQNGLITLLRHLLERRKLTITKDNKYLRNE